MKGSLVKNPYYKRYFSKKTERNTFKFSSLVNILILYVYISNKMGDLLINQVTKRCSSY